MKLSNKALRAAKIAAPIVAIVALALAAWMWFRRSGKKERYSQFQARQWKWGSDGTGAYKCASGWKDTGLDSPPPTTKDGTWQGGDKSARHCRQAKNTAFSGTIWDDDKGESVCPTGFKATGESGERACKKKDYEGVDAGCNKDYPIRGQRTGYEGRCCKDKFSRKCEGKTSMEASGKSGCPWDYPYKGTRDFNMGKCCKGGSSRKCQGDAPPPKSATWTSGPAPPSGISRKYPYWGWAGTKNEGLRCKYNNNTGCDTKWEGSVMKDAKSTTDQGSKRNLKTGEYCTGGNQCESGVCSSGKKCVAKPVDQGSKRNLKTGEYCTGGNQCQSGVCSSGKKCVAKWVDQSCTAADGLKGWRDSNGVCLAVAGQFGCKLSDGSLGYTHGNGNCKWDPPGGKR